MHTIQAECTILMNFPVYAFLFYIELSSLNSLLCVYMYAYFIQVPQTTKGEFAFLVCYLFTRHHCHYISVVNRNTDHQLKDATEVYITRIIQKGQIPQIQITDLLK